MMNVVKSLMEQLQTERARSSTLKLEIEHLRLALARAHFRCAALSARAFVIGAVIGAVISAVAVGAVLLAAK